MTLQEKALMCDLINKNYRRRMFWFFLNVLIFIASISFTVFAIITKMPGVIQFVSLLMTAITALPQILLNADDVKFPWVVKKRQSDVLHAHSERDFAELINSVPMAEYFYV